MYAVPQVRKWLAYSVVFASLTGCTFLQSFAPKSGDSTDIIDRQQHLSVDDFRNLNNADKLLKDEPLAADKARV